MPEPVSLRVRDRTYASAAELLAALRANWYPRRDQPKQDVDLRPRFIEPPCEG